MKGEKENERKDKMKFTDILKKKNLYLFSFVGVGVTFYIFTFVGKHIHS